MRLTLGLTATLLFVVALIVAARGEGAGRAAATAVAKQAGDRLVVHEWGTFTSFSGSDSVTLEFRPLVDADLPPFVLDRGRQSGIPKPFAKINLSVLQRMETPVTYFYTDRARQVNARVGFPQGLLTEFFPPVEKMEPEFKPLEPESLTDSVLDWGRVWIVPEHRLRANVADTKLAGQLQTRMLQSLLPPTDAQDHYAYARETDSALVYVERPRDPRHPLAPSGAYFEKFLFYRGVGNFQLPLELAAHAGGRFELSNLGADPIRSLFLVTVDGEQLRFAKYEGIRAGERLTLVQSENVSSVEELTEAVVQELINEKLYEKEARAMVKTWRSSWFGESGTRLFYMLPQTLTDELLPLEIEPRPDEIVRVMVGRLEIMRPEDEARVAELVKKSVRDRAAAAAAEKKARQAGSEAKAYALPQTILQLGRLAEPALVRVHNISRDAAVRNEAGILLAQLRQYRNTLARPLAALSD